MKLLNRYPQFIKPGVALSLATAMLMAPAWSQDFEVFEDYDNVENVEILEEPLEVVRPKVKERRIVRRKVKRPRKRRRILEEETVYAARDLQNASDEGFAQESYARDGVANNTRNDAVQIVNVEATSDNRNKQNQNLESGIEVDSFAGMYRNERRRYEARNNSRIIEKLEIDRIKNEKRLEGKIEDWEGAEVVNPKTEVQVVEVEHVDVHPGHSKYHVSPFSKWSLAPVVGYRSKEGGRYDAESGFMLGVAMEGNINRFLSFEAGLNFSQHEFSCANKNTWGHGGHHFGPRPCDYMARSATTYDINANVKAHFAQDFNQWKPYGLLGLGLVHTEYDIDTNRTKAIAEASGWKRATDNTTLNVGVGIDYIASANVNVGFRYTYQMFLGEASKGMDDFYGDSNATSTFSGSVAFKF